MSKARPGQPAAVPPGGVALLLALLGVSSALQAQSLSPQQLRQIDQQINISRDRVPASGLRSPSLELRILTPEQSSIPRAVDELEFELSQIQVDGATYFSKPELEPVFAPLLGRKVALPALREAARALENKYRERGFFLARVFVPPQQLKAGVFRVQVIEGHIARVLIDSAQAAIGERVEAMSRVLVNLRPLSLASLERVLLLINDLPGVSATAVLRPGAEFGTSELLLSIAPAAPVHLGTFSNTGSQTIGPYALNYNSTFQHLMGGTGQLNLNLTATGAGANQLKGIRSVALRYAQAIGASGLILTLGGTQSKSRPGGSLTSLNLLSESSSLSSKLHYPLLRSRTNSLFLDAGLTVNSTNTTMSGAVLTSDRATAGDLALIWSLNGWLSGVQTLTLGVARGMDLFGAIDRNAPNPSSAGFEPRFTKTTLSLQRTQELAPQFSLRLSANTQHSRDRLLAGEHIAFGGPALGRGFAPGAIAGDRGRGGMLELRYDFKLKASPQIGNLQAYASTDSASTRSVAVPALGIDSTRAHLNSEAIGLRLSLGRNTQLDLRYADGHQNLHADDPRRNRRLLIEATLVF